MKNLPDLPKHLKLEPTEQEIRVGVCNSPTKCMYALTIHRMFPLISYVKVNPNGITITYNGYYHHYHIPNNGALALLAFDNRNRVLTPENAIINCKRTSIEQSRYKNTPEVREYHRMNSAKRRADPNYKRSDLGGMHRRTIRARIANSTLELKKNDHASEDHEPAT